MLLVRTELIEAARVVQSNLQPLGGSLRLRDYGTKPLGGEVESTSQTGAAEMSNIIMILEGLSEAEISAAYTRSMAGA